MADTIFETLQEGSFDGIVMPVQAIRIATGSAKAFHAYPFRAGVDIEYTGREPVSGTITCVFVNGLDDVGGTNDLWPGAMELLRNRVQEQKSGPLVLPTLGKLPFAAIDIDESYTVDFVDGTVVQVKFVEDSGDQFAGLTIKSARGQLGASASNADAAIAGTGIPTPNEQADDGTSLTSFSAWANNVLGQIDQLGENIAVPIRQLTRIAQSCDDILSTVESLRTVQNWEIASALRDLDATSLKAIDEISRAQDLTTYVTRGSTNIGAVARATKNSVEEILSLNEIDFPHDIDAGETLLVFLK